jgi:hypothetical protein
MGAWQPGCTPAHTLDSVSRAEAAPLAGMERQALRDPVGCCNADGLEAQPPMTRPTAIIPACHQRVKEWSWSSPGSVDGCGLTGESASRAYLSNSAGDL